MRGLLLVGLLTTTAGSEASGEESPTAPPVRSGQLLERSYERALECLGEGDAKGFVEGYGQFARLADGLATSVVERAETIGEADALATLVADSLEALRESGEGHGEVAEFQASIVASRFALLQRLQGVRDAIEEGSVSEEERLALDELASRIEELDRWQDALRLGAGPIVSDDSIDEVAAECRASAESLDARRQELPAIAASLAATLARIDAELSRSVALLEAHATVPRAHLDRLRREGRLLANACERLQEARRQSATSLRRAVGTPVCQPKACERTLHRVDRLLGRCRPTAGR